MKPMPASPGIRALLSTLADGGLDGAAEIRASRADSRSLYVKRGGASFFQSPKARAQRRENARIVIEQALVAEFGGQPRLLRYLKQRVPELFHRGGAVTPDALSALRVELELVGGAPRPSPAGPSSSSLLPGARAEMLGGRVIAQAPLALASPRHENSQTTWMSCPPHLIAAAAGVAARAPAGLKDMLTRWLPLDQQLANPSDTTADPYAKALGDLRHATKYLLKRRTQPLDAFTALAQLERKSDTHPGGPAPVMACARAGERMLMIGVVPEPAGGRQFVVFDATWGAASFSRADDLATFLAEDLAASAPLADGEVAQEAPAKLVLQRVDLGRLQELIDRTPGFAALRVDYPPL